MMLVRSSDEETALLAVVETQGGLMKVLERCGVPRAWGEKALDTQAKQRGVAELA
jgi:ATP adenylyltransferase